MNIYAVARMGSVKNEAVHNNAFPHFKNIFKVLRVSVKNLTPP